MRVFYWIIFCVLPQQVYALTCASYDEYYFSEQENVAVITVVDAKLIDYPRPKVVVTFRLDEVLLGNVPASRSFSFEPNQEPWPIGVDVGQKYIVPFPSPDIEWGACSKSSYRYDACTVYGIKQLTGSGTERDPECHKLLLRRKAIHLSEPTTAGDRIQIIMKSEAELQEYVNKLIKEKES